MVFLKAFFTGGAICLFSQILLDHTKLLPGRIMVLLVVAGVLTGAVGIFEPFAKWAGCGATVPLCGFGYRLWDGVKSAVDHQGILGLFTGGFQASAVGICGALVFAIITALLFNPRMKR